VESARSRGFHALTVLTFTAPPRKSIYFFVSTICKGPVSGAGRAAGAAAPARSAVRPPVRPASPCSDRSGSTPGRCRQRFPTSTTGTGGAAGSERTWGRCRCASAAAGSDTSTGSGAATGTGISAAMAGAASAARRARPVRRGLVRQRCLRGYRHFSFELRSASSARAACSACAALLRLGSFDALAATAASRVLAFSALAPGHPRRAVRGCVRIQRRLRALFIPWPGLCTRVHFPRRTWRTRSRGGRSRARGVPRARGVLRFRARFAFRALAALRS